MPQRPIGRLVLALVLSAVVLYVLYALRYVWLLFYVATVLAVMFDPAVRFVASHTARWSSVQSNFPRGGALHVTG
jgi:predicted PurR-regulated permease PerM